MVPKKGGNEGIICPQVRDFHLFLKNQSRIRYCPFEVDAQESLGTVRWQTQGRRSSIRAGFYECTRSDVRHSSTQAAVKSLAFVQGMIQAVRYLL